MLLFRLFGVLLGVSVVGCSAHLELSESEGAIEVRRDGKPMLVYNIAVVGPPAGLDPVYERSGFIHPVFSPTGQVVTDGFPLDHAHQHALFFAWTKTTFKGQEVDFWNSAKGQGRVFHDKVLSVERLGGRVSFSVALKHQELVSEAKEVVLDEVWTVTAYEGSDDVFVFDLESVQRAATDEPLILNEYHYGGAGFRFSEQWGLVDGEAPFAFTLSEGDGRVEGNHTAQRWVGGIGMIDGGNVSLVVLSHPENFRSPQKVRLHPKMPYFSYSPVVDGEYSIEKGKPYRSRYRYLVGAKVFEREWLEAQWSEFAASEGE